jgi:recombination protein RecA
MAAKKDQKKSEELSPEDAKYQAVMSQIEKEFGKGSVMSLGSKGAVSCSSIPTGVFSLDMALGVGGFPRGRVVEIYGPESSGKTTVCLTVIERAQAAGGRCAIVDTEHALDPQYATFIGVDINRLVVSQPDCGEDALNIVEMMVRSGVFSVVVVDSVAALVPRAEIEGSMGDSHVGLHARLMSQALRKLTSAVAQSSTCLIFTNQIREKIGVMFGNPETTTGGNALKFYASIRMDIRRKEALGEKDRPTGFHTRIKIVKNKLAAPFRIAEFDIIFPNGIDKAGNIIDMAIENEIVEKRGAWFSYGSDQLGQGRDQTKDTIRNDPKLYASIEKALLAKVKGEKVVSPVQKDAVPDSVENIVEDSNAEGSTPDDQGLLEDPGQ